MTWSIAAPAVMAAFLASLVEVVEAFTIVLAVATLRGWRSAALHFTYNELEENDVELKKLQGWLEKIKKLDFYGGGLATDAAARLKVCEGLLEDYAQRVFDAHDEDR